MVSENKFFFRVKDFVSKILNSIKGVNEKFRIIMKIFTVNSAVLFATKPIKWPIVFIETTRKRGS